MNPSRVIACRDLGRCRDRGRNGRLNANCLRRPWCWASRHGGRGGVCTLCSLGRPGGDRGNARCTVGRGRYRHCWHCGNRGRGHERLIAGVTLNRLAGRSRWRRGNCVAEWTADLVHSFLGPSSIRSSRSTFSLGPSNGFGCPEVLDGGALGFGFVSSPSERLSLIDSCN